MRWKLHDFFRWMTYTLPITVCEFSFLMKENDSLCIHHLYFFEKKISTVSYHETNKNVNAIGSSCILVTVVDRCKSWRLGESLCTVATNQSTAAGLYICMTLTNYSYQSIQVRLNANKRRLRSSVTFGLTLVKCRCSVLISLWSGFHLELREVIFN
jgi:hypothetical protein